MMQNGTPVMLTTAISRGELCYYVGLHRSDIRFRVEPDELPTFGFRAEELTYPAEVALDERGCRAFSAMLDRHNAAHCPDRCVAHLALHARKARTRKKNIGRMHRLIAMARWKRV